ncbi:MAG: hypothetical protein O2954_15630 [bacterium]|nr:hypothetical protein [bacterium]
MMLDEPYRWAEAVSNRRDYVEDQLQDGSPVVGLAYRDGILLLTLGQGQQKIFEIYNRVSMAGLGHPTDLEKLRQAAVDMASSIGFNYSEADVTLQQIVHFGLGPAVKTSFDEVLRSPYIVQILLAELDGMDGENTFYTVDYDGAFYKSENWATVGGISEAGPLMNQQLVDLEPGKLTLRKALDAALTAWAAGRWVGQLEDIPNEISELEKAAEGVDLKGILKLELETLEVEAVVLERSRPGKEKYRVLSQEEINPALKAYRG